MKRLRHLFSQPVPEPPGDVSYERSKLRYDDIRHGWPRRLQRIREELPRRLAEAGPPGMARYGTWIVTAHVDGYPVGLVWSVPYVGERNWAYVEEAAVLGLWQRNGVGSKLVVEAMIWLRELGFGVVALYPTSGSTWIERLGFEPADGKQFTRGLTDLSFAGRANDPG